MVKLGHNSPITVCPLSRVRGTSLSGNGQAEKDMQSLKLVLVCIFALGLAVTRSEMAKEEILLERGINDELYPSVKCKRRFLPITEKSSVLFRY